MSAITESDEVETGSDGEVSDFSRLKKWVIDSHRARSKWRKEAERAFAFVASDQWDEEDKILLDAQNRPSVTFNRSAPIIKAVCGLEVNNRQSVIYLPRKLTPDGADAELDESRTQCAKWVRDVCGAEDEESEGFKDLAVCGEGWTETRMDFDDNPRGQITEERIDPLEMGVNEGAKRANYKDARMIYRVREMDVYDAKALFPNQNYNAGALHCRWLDTGPTPADGGEGNKTDYPRETRSALEREGGIRTKVKIVQVQWWDREPRYLVAQEGDDKLQEMTETEYHTYTARVTSMQEADVAAMQNHVATLEATPELHRSLGVMADGVTPLPEAPTPTAPKYTMAKVAVKVYYEAFLGEGLLDKQPITLKTFRFKCMTGERDRKGKCFYGMLRDMFDPQMWANKWLSQTMHIMNTNAKGGIMAETDAFVNVKKAEKDWADNTKIIWVKPGSLQKEKVKERTPPPLPQGLGELMQFALSSLRDVTGVNLEMLGQADREQAASLEQQRRQSAMTILATLFDSKRRYSKEQGRLILKFIELLPAGTLYRVVDNDKVKYVPLIKEGDVEEYDVILDETPSSPDQKQLVWALTIQLLGQGIQLPAPVIIKLLKYSPYPSSVVKEISDAMGLGSELPPEQLKVKLDQAEQALQVMEKQLTDALQAAKTEGEQIKIQTLETAIKGFQAETARLQAMWTAKVNVAKAITDATAVQTPTEGA